VINAEIVFLCLLSRLFEVKEYKNIIPLSIFGVFVVMLEANTFKIFRVANWALCTIQCRHPYNQPSKCRLYLTPSDSHPQGLGAPQGFCDTQHKLGLVRLG
jgi:hypothetical protein